MGSANGKVNLDSPSLFINRELSWLEFNKRVLEEAQDKGNPLLERVKFLAIFFTNLDEFFMIRVAGLKKMLSAGINSPSFDGLPPKEQLRRISKKTRELLKETEKTYKELLRELKEEDIYLYSYKELPKKLKKKADAYFKEFVFPVLTPLAVDLTHPFPHLPSLSFNIIVEMISTELRFGLVPVPKVLPRFVELEKGKYILIEELILNHLTELFPQQKIRSSATFRLTRDADIIIQEDEADDLLEAIEKGLRRRRFGAPVRLEVNGGSELLLTLLKDELELQEQDIYQLKIPLNLSDLWELYAKEERSDLKFPPYVPYYPPQFEVEVFTALKNKSSILYHPYESFDPIVELVEEAAEDPNVLAIKQTLYRVGKNSPIVEALSKAAQNGKEVTAVVELKARFDEESNIVWAKKLEEDGVHVVYGVPGLKTHAKLLMIVRKEEGKIKRYVHLGTGNYNVETAKVYTDISYLTSDEEIGEDVSRIFNVITGYFHPPELKKLFISPVNLKEKVLSLIEEEKERIVAKMNSLVDPEIIKALYRASMRGVKVDLIVRGICCLRPQVKGISENIRVISIVGKYLEHARIFYFKTPDKVFISSADWMPRNFHRRVETLVPVEEENLKVKLKEILEIQLKDTAKARLLRADGTYYRPSKRDFNSQEYFERWVREFSL